METETIGLPNYGGPLLDFIPTENIWWIILGVLALIFLVHGTIVAYHWFTFGTEKSIPTLAAVIYFGVGFLLLSIMITILLFF